MNCMSKHRATLHDKSIVKKDKQHIKEFHYNQTRPQDQFASNHLNYKISRLILSNDDMINNCFRNLVQQVC